MNPSQYYMPSRVLANTQYSFSKRLTGAARLFQEGTGPASFNSNRVEPGYARARLLFLYVATFIASTL